MMDDADKKARNMVSQIDQLLTQREYGEADFVARRALREAERRGMMRAAGIAWERVEIWMLVDDAPARTMEYEARVIHSAIIRLSAGNRLGTATEGGE